MSDLYNRIISLCKEKNVSGYRMCKDIGIQPSILTDLKMGRQNGLSAKNADKMAAYFAVSVGYLLGTDTKKAPTQEGEREITFDDFTFAMQNESKDLTEADKQILLSMAKQLNDARKKRNGESK
ncbi:helix-turn-helix transcriptional regulator [Lawsonibacter asaccharolyticus]